MTTINGAELANQKIRWFFTSDQSRYELAEVTRIALTTKDNIQNWVRREMVKPDQVTPGRRVYAPLTVADIKVATILVEMNVSPAMAFMAARVVNVITLKWYKGEDWDDGDPFPPFEKDIRHQFAVFSWAPSSIYDNPRMLYPGIVGCEELGKYLWDRSPSAHTVIPIGRCWIDLADTAKALKERSSKRFGQEASN